MQVFLGADHQGFHLKEKIFAYLAKREYSVKDVGDKELDPNDDFPEFAQLAALGVLGSEDPDSRAILICGGGQGMCIAANRFRGIRAVVVWDSKEAEMSRRDNDSNVLCLPARVLQNDDHEWQAIIDAWLKTPFANAAKYIRRNRQLDELS